MKALSSSMLAVVLAALPIVCSPASTDKTLQTQDGTVTYGATQNPTTKLAKNASATLNDSDWAKTGTGNSKATVTLPDSSVVTMAADSQVQMQNFDNAGGTNTANFVVVGKVRFNVKHPAGAKASYTFSTPTGQIAVRGTEGDIFSQPGANGAPGGLQVNVYELTDPALPVQVKLVNGQVFTLSAGQSLVVTAAGGALVSAVGAVSQTTFAPFAQLGAPVNASTFGITATTAGTTAGAVGAAAASTTATVTATAIAVGTAAAVTTASNNSSSTPAPKPTGTTVPITISGRPGPAAPAGPAAPSAGSVAPPVPHLPGTVAPVAGRPDPMPHPLGRPSPPVR